VSDKLAPLIEQQGPWLLSVYSSIEDTDVWAVYVKFTDESRALLHKWKDIVKKLRKKSDLFYSLQIWNPVDIRFLGQGPYANTDFREFIE